MTLAEARAAVGRSVVRHVERFHHEGDVLVMDEAIIESGTITSVNDAYVFVRYGADTGSKATVAEELEFE